MGPSHTFGPLTDCVAGRRRIPRPGLVKAGLGRWIGPVLALSACLLAAGGQEAESSGSDSRILTRFSEIWGLSEEDRGVPHRIKTEVVIYYFDAEWKSVWGECRGVPMFLPLGDTPRPLKPGQRVMIDGVIAPREERMDWARTEIRVLEENVPRIAEPIAGLRERAAMLKGHLVSVEGLIDTQKIAARHVTMGFLAGDMPVTAFVLRDSDPGPLRFRAGDWVRIKCVYAPQLDQDGNIENLELWVARTEDVEIIGSLKTDMRFAIPRTPIELIRENLPTNQLVRVRGTVRKHETGKWLVVWDETGQVTVESRQAQALRQNDRVEAIGYPYVRGVHQALRHGLYRASPESEAKADEMIPGRVLRLAAQVRDLSREQAMRGHPVKLRGLVTWSHAESAMAYVADDSCGIQVVNPQWDAEDTSKPGTIVEVEGVTAAGTFVPVLTNALLRRVGWWNLKAMSGKPVTLEQALTGWEEGRWVEMTGYAREVHIRQGLRHIQLTTSSGDFEASVPSSRTLKFLEGSIVRVRGVCAATVNARQQLTGAHVWIPDSSYITVEEPEAADVFAAPLRPISSLRQFSAEGSLHRKTRTCGTVSLHVPGRYVYIQDGADAVCALSRMGQPLRPGDRVEVVGFLGNQMGRLLLREAVYRRMNGHADLVPVAISSLPGINLDAEGMLARAEGLLLSATEKNGEARLLLHSGDSAFEASLNPAGNGERIPVLSLEPGSRLAVTGVYEVQSDEYGNPGSFLLRMRGGEDVQLLRRPPWWTLERLMKVLLGLLMVAVIALFWGIVIARKNRQLCQAQGQLQAANDELERRVLERTRELERQVADKERARAELAETQEHLVATSRQAGMAEVATGVLHNVGNVLNSVNISAGIVTERLQQCPWDSVSRVAALLQSQQHQLARFFTEDPKGKALPSYLDKLGKVLLSEKAETHNELELLVKNIDHIKTIVAMQQNYARVGGVLEDVDPKDLIEDAIQINGASLQNGRIEVVRDYQVVPRVLVDRHKVLQIMVNLVSNARHALREKPTERKLTVKLSSSGSDRVCIAVIDNGVGIAPENLSRIFSQGFTTRKDGHGFGLHSGAIAAKELNGSLSAYSSGLGSGASFVLELPTTTLIASDAPRDSRAAQIAADLPQNSPLSALPSGDKS